VFVGYCPNCTKTYFGNSRGGDLWAHEITPEMIDILWQKLSYMKGTEFHMIGEEMPVVEETPDQLAEQILQMEENQDKWTYQSHCKVSGICDCYGCKQYRKEHFSEEVLRTYGEWEEKEEMPSLFETKDKSSPVIHETTNELPEDRMWHIVDKKNCLCSQCMTEEQYIDFLDNENRFESWPAHEYDTPAIRAIRIRVNDRRRPYYGDSFISHWEISDELLNRFMG
jgi:hypothetical protein